MRTIVSWIRFAWRWSLLVTAPLGILFVVWAFRTADRYQEFGLRFRTLNDAVSLTNTGVYEAHALKRDLVLVASPAARNAPSKLPIIQLFIEGAAEAGLNDNLPHSGREYVDAAMMYPDGEIKKVSLRYKGDHFWHWAARKKSLRVKTKRKRLFHRMRSFSLNAPKMTDMIGEYLSYEFADDFELIRPRGQFTEVWVNGEYRGVHLLIEQLEEMVIRVNGRMPGDLYSADMVKREQWTGVDPYVFLNAGLWEKKAINNHFGDDETSNLERLVELVKAAPSPERTIALRDLVDIDAFARFHAYRIICQTQHYDRTHNQRLYYDPWRNVFEPLVWDPVGWHPGWVPKNGAPPQLDILRNELDQALYEDPTFLAARQDALETWYAGGGAERLVERSHELAQMLAPSVARDPALVSLYDALTPSDVFDAQTRLTALIGEICSDIRSKLLSPPEVSYATSPAEYPNSLRVKIDGLTFCSALNLEFQSPVDSGMDLRVSFHTPSGKRTIDIAAALEISGNKALIAFPLGPQYTIPGPDERRNASMVPCTVKPVTYDITLTGTDLNENPLLDVIADGPLGAQVSAHRAESIMGKIAFESTYDLGPEQPLESPINWSGTMSFEGAHWIERDVVIQPGTTLEMGPEASIIIEGRVIARGTEDAPIRVIRKQGQETPWGVLTIRGEGADGSSLAWCELHFGSGRREPDAEFTGMLSIHDVDDVTLSHCTFADSQTVRDLKVDDMVHAVYSTVLFEGCTFVRARMDALDIDISEAEVRDCDFIDTGNDALDLMTSTVAVVDSRMIRNGDKGISVGEDTRAFVIGCVVDSGKIGVQIKDRSSAVLVNCDIHNSLQGIDAYKKNWRYDSGGFAYVYRCSIVDNESPEGVPSQITADKHSRIMVHDSFISPMVKPTKRIILDEATDDKRARKTRLRKLERFQDEQARSPQYFAPFWSRVSGRRRGRVASD